MGGSSGMLFVPTYAPFPLRSSGNGDP